jgi:hypothetical protein
VDPVAEAAPVAAPPPVVTALAVDPPDPFDEVPPVADAVPVSSRVPSASFAVAPSHPESTRSTKASASFVQFAMGYPWSDAPKP